VARKIVKAEAEIERPEEIFVELTGGITILLSLKPKLQDPKFAQIKELSLLPKTDGGRVYWENGASLTVKEIMTMQRADSGREIN